MIVDLAIGDQHLPTILAGSDEGLCAVRQIDNRQAGVHQSASLVAIAPAAVRTAMRQGTLHPVEHLWRGSTAGPQEIAANAAHQPATFTRKSIQSDVTCAGDSLACQWARPAAASRLASAGSPLT